MSGTMLGSNYWDLTAPTVATALQTAAGAISVAQNIFYADTSYAGATSVPADIFNPDTMSIEEGVTQQFVEITSEFRLTSGQAQDMSGTTAMTLATFAARNLALAQDLVFFQGANVELPKTVRIETGRESAGKGLFGLAQHEIHVKPGDTKTPTNSGLEILAAVIEGVSVLASPKNLQPGKFVVILDNHAYAAAGGSAINGIPTLTVLSSLTAMLTEQVYNAAGLPPLSGVIASLAGDVGQPGGPTTIYIGKDVSAEYLARESSGAVIARVCSRTANVFRDRRSVIKLNFDAYRNEVKS